MNVIIVNESEKKALISSRRVLSRYLPQVGLQTWAGLISAEGLKDLEGSLRVSASKNTSVACHVVRTRSRMALLWIVGSRRHFDEDGRYAYRSLQLSKALPDFVQTHTPAQRYLAGLLRLAALFHDLGKANVAYQKKLHKGKGYEVLRHDLLSMLMVAQSLGVPESDEVWLQRLVDDPAAAASCASETSLLQPNDPWLRAIEQSLASKNGVLLVKREELEDRFVATPGLQSLLWLVLTHHRLPAGTESGEQLDVALHLNRCHDEPAAPAWGPPASLAECLKPAKGELPWASRAWLEDVRRVASQTLAALKAMQAEGSCALLSARPHEWALLGAHLLRPNLILADHLASLQAKDSGPVVGQSNKHPLANTVGRGRAGDDLTTHLRRAQQHARRLQGLALAAQRFPATGVAAGSPLLQEGLAPRFAWQERLSRACAQEADVPTFVAIIAETGAGKTLGGLRAAHALGGGSLRLTMALSMRSLTWQTGQSALEDARIAPEDLVIAVGQPQSLELADRAESLAAADQERHRRFGSSSAEGPDDESLSLATLVPEEGGARVTPLTASPPPERLAWLSGLCSPAEAAELWGARTLNVVSAPVLACTADHLVQATRLLRGGDVKAWLRLVTSDLLLDEIDSYSPQDLQSVGKLALVAGLGGRNLIAMSATASPAVIEGLYSAWRAGLQARRLLLPQAQHRVIFSSHIGEPVSHCGQDAAAFGSAWQEYARGVCAVYADDELSPPRRRVQVLALSGCSSREDAFERINAATRELHALNGHVDPATGRRVSVGFVRFSTAKTAWRCAQYLARRAPEPGHEHRVLALHSKYPRTHLGVLDAVLKRLCTRKAGADPLRDCAELRRFVDGATAQDLRVIVCTTSLIETGRDFDFDWAVLEPRSTRAEVQAAGRLRRHRAGRWEATNVLMLEWPLRRLESSARIWSMPGVEDYMGRSAQFALNVMPDGVVLPSPAPPAPAGALPAKKLAGWRIGADGWPTSQAPDPVLCAKDALPLEKWAHKLDAQVCLQSPDPANYAADRLGAWEQHFQAQHLTQRPRDFSESSGQVPSLAWYSSSLAPLFQTHARLTPFRESNGRQALFVPPAPGGARVRFFDEVAREMMASTEAQVVQEPRGQYLVADLDERAAALTDGQDANLVGAALRTGKSGPAHAKLTWCPQLGFLEKEGG